MAQPLFQPYKLGGKLDLQHRVVLAPLTRLRSFDNKPTPSVQEYYAQRASEGGLLITEATIVGPRGYGAPCMPGIHRPDQIEAWKPVVAGVKDKGAFFFCQIFHAGRASAEEYQPDGELPIAPSAIPITEDQCFSLKSMGMVPYPTPRALELEEIPGLVGEFRQAARNALDAGFDGVEIHCANGYIIDQFLKTESNKRSDEYGGSIDNRCRFALEIITAVTEEIGAERVGVRLSPFGGFQNARDEHPFALATYLLEELNKFGLAYVHMVEPRVGGYIDIECSPAYSLDPFRKVYRGTMIIAGAHTHESGSAAVESGATDLVAYGRWFISNPDLPLRFKLGAPLTPYDRNTFYTQGDEGYLDYPFLAAEEVVVSV